MLIVQNLRFVFSDSGPENSQGLAPAILGGDYSTQSCSLKPNKVEIPAEDHERTGTSGQSDDETGTKTAKPGKKSAANREELGQQ